MIVVCVCMYCMEYECDEIIIGTYVCMNVTKWAEFRLHLLGNICICDLSLAEI